MTDRIKTVSDLVRALGGPTQVGRAVGVGAEAVCNWQARNAVPRRHHLAVWQLAQAAKVAWQPPGTEGVTLAPAPTAEAA